jgi:hypothetical protein
MGIRRKRKDRILADQRTSRKVNGARKEKETTRRGDRVMSLVKAGTFPYTPVVMSWLSQTLGKPGRQITQADVDHLLATAGKPA